MEVVTRRLLKKLDDEVIIYDNEIMLWINPNKFEVHMIQYTLKIKNQQNELRVNCHLDRINRKIWVIRNYERWLILCKSFESIIGDIDYNSLFVKIIINYHHF